MHKKHILKFVLNPISMLIIGLCLGIISRLLDIYTQNLGNIFSQMSIWILFGTIISIYSDTKKKAMFHILPFCIGMLITYYVVAMKTNGVYSEIFIIGWTVFSLFCPILAYFTWITKEKGVLPKVIAIGVVSCSVVVTIILFDKLRVYDFVINIVLIYFLFFKKVKR